jgi:hypothetical protein
MPSFNGAEALKQVKAQNPQLPFMFVSGTLPSDLARSSRMKEPPGSCRRTTWTASCRRWK